MAEETKEKKPGFVSGVLGFPKRLSLPAYWSCLTSVMLIVVVTVAWIFFFTGKDNVHGALGWWRIILVLLLVVAIPIVLYRGLKLWLEGDKSRFPDIDYAWNAGIKALQQNGLSMDSAPVFLVLGSHNERHEREFMRAAGHDFRVRAVPEGASPLHWYAEPDAIFLFCTDASWLSALAALAEKKPIENVTPAPLPATAPPVPRATPATPPAAGGGGVAQPSQPATAAPAASTPARGTVMLDQFLNQQPSAAQPTPPPATPASYVAEQSSSGSANPDSEPLPQPMAVIPGTIPTGQEEVLAVVSPVEATERLQRLQYVCQLLRGSRKSLCGVNGILTLLPFQLMQSSPVEVEELQRAIKSDLLAIQRELRVRCPVTSLVVGLDRETGFSELVRRVGPERAVSQRFGRRFDVRTLAQRNELTIYCEHVCGVFEDWVHTLFREQQALTRPGNTRLYSLLCKVRCNLKTRLAEILVGGYGYDERQFTEDDPFLFSGCYFAATGETPDRQAFVKGVIDKLIDEQEYVEWSQQALIANRRYRRLAIVGFLISAALLTNLVWMLTGRS